uniref:Venom peptide HtRyRTx1 n=1 Tax=Hadogenes troglodytes TaxID=1577150 RepID=A0A1B3IJ19_9SCOR|nr:venom peptide HtRyRTx1 [Hadogenes troglodytes]
MKSSAVVMIFILAFITITCLNTYETSELRSGISALLRQKRDCKPHLKLCKNNRECCSNKCKRRGTNAEQRCRT